MKFINLLEEELFVNKMKERRSASSAPFSARPTSPLFSLDFGGKLHNNQIQNRPFLFLPPNKRYAINE